MAKLLLKKMVIENFKGMTGVHEFEFSPNVTHIKGANGTGKTTIADAFSWALFGKNAKGDTPGSDTFREKPLNENGEEIHNLVTSVLLDCELDGAPMLIQRTQVEKWVRERGSIKPVFQGNTTHYYINAMELKLREFNTEIAKICPDEAFRFVSTLSAFNNADWKKRRAILLNMTSDNVDEELLNSGKYAEMNEKRMATGGVAIDSYIKVVKDKTRELRKTIDQIPVRIDEAKKALPKHTEQDIADAEYAVKETRESIGRIDEMIASLGSTSADEARLASMEAERETLIAKLRNDRNAKIGNLQLETEMRKAEARTADRDAEAARQAIIGAERKLIESTKLRDKLRKDYIELRDKPVTKIDSVCPTCGQALPESEVQKAQSALEEDKMNELLRIREQGSSVASEITAYENEIVELKETFAKADEAYKAATKAYEAAKKRADDAVNESAGVDFTENERVATLAGEIAALKRNLGTSTEDKKAAYRARRSELEARLLKAQMVITESQTSGNAQLRINELEEQLTEVGIQLSESESTEILLEEFMKDRCKALENIINSKFENVRWKLFDTAINGSITETCVCMIPCNGTLVPYSSANTASSINADISICETLSKYYGVELPILVDNFERLSWIKETNAQLVTMAVTNDTELVIEKE